ncbi:MAG: histidine kinase [Chitinophagales bacterium]
MPKSTKAQQVYEQTKPLYEAGDYKRCITVLKRIFRREQPEENPTLYHSIANRLGNCYTSLGDVTNAEFWYKEALLQAEKTKTPQQLYAGLNNLATVYLHTNQYRSAIEYLQKSIDIKEQCGNKADTSTGLLQIAGLFFKLENMEAGKKALKQAYTLIRQHKQLPLYAHLHFTTGMMLKREQQHKQACRQYDLAARYALQHKDTVLASRCHSNKAGILLEAKEWKKAKKSLKLALELTRKHGVSVDELNLCNQLALVALELKKYKQCGELLAYIRSKAPGVANDMVYEGLEELSSRYYETIGQPAQALKHYKYYLEYYKKEYDHEMSRSITDMQAKYENEKKERELQEAKLQQAESELKALRTQMNPHFIFNALSGIRQSMLEENTELADRLIMRFSRLLRLILDTSRKPVMPLSQNIELLHLYIQIEQSRQNNRFSYQIEVDEEINPEATFVHGLILQPLVENSILHGLFHKTEGGGQLRISFSKVKNKLSIAIADNGIGREKAAQFRKKEHQSHATGMIHETLQLLWKTTDTKPYFSVTDLMDEKKQPAGTLVKVCLPLSYTATAFSE